MFENDDFQWDLDGDSFLLSLPVSGPSNPSNVGSKRKMNTPNWSKNDAIEISNVEDVPDDLPQVLFQRKKEDRDEEPPPPKHSRSCSPSRATTTNNVRQKFPGPAGVIGKSIKKTLQMDGPSPSEVLSQPTCTQLQLESVISQMTDQNTVWKFMLSNEECSNTDNSPSLLSTYNIAWAKQKLSKTEFLFKMPILAGAINALDVTFGMDPRGELVDPTGVTSCIFHRDFIERHGSILLLPGTVILLQNVTVVKMSTGKMSVTITINNLVSIYYKRGQKELYEKVVSLSKDEVRRNAARLNRDEKALSRMLEQETDSQASSSAPSLASQFVPGLTSSPMTFQPFRPPVASFNRLQGSTHGPVGRPQSTEQPQIRPALQGYATTSPSSTSANGSVNNASNGISFGLENPKIVGSTNLTSSSNSKFTFQKRIGESQYPVQGTSLFSDSKENNELSNLLEGLDEDSIFGDF